MNKLIVLDLDGTALDYDMKISPELIEQIGEIKEKNRVIIATGRSVSDAFRYYEQLKLDTYLICYNGGFIWNPIKKHIIKEYYQDSWKNLIDYLVNNLQKYKIRNFVVSVRERTYIYNAEENPYLWGIMIDDNLPCYTIDWKRSVMPTRAHRIVIAVEPNFLQQIKKEIEANFHDVDIYSWRGRNDIIDISLRNVEKWEAILEVAKEYNIPRQKIISFGDAKNDKCMLSNSGIGIAMKNATDDVKNVTNYVTKFSNNENGVAIFIEQNRKIFD